MANVPSPSDWSVEALLGMAVAAITGLVGWVFRHLTSKLDHIEETANAALPRVEFERARNESLEDRADIRKDIKELFSRDDKMKDMLHDEFTKLAAMVNTQAENLRLMLDNKIEALRHDVRQAGERRGAQR